MSRPTLLICRRCVNNDVDDDDADRQTGENLYQNVKALRRQLEFKKVFAVEGVKCLSLCDTPCNVQFEGKKRSTYTRSELDAARDVDQLVKAAVAYAALEPGEELPERLLPGVFTD